MVICLERGADLHMAQLMPLPLIVSCFGKIQIGFTFLVPAHPGSPRKRAVKGVYISIVYQDFLKHAHTITIHFTALLQITSISNLSLNSVNLPVSFRASMD